MPAFGRQSPGSDGAAGPDAEASPCDVRGGAPASIERELDRLHRELNGSAYANPLADAKAALAAGNHQDAAALVSATWESYRDRRWKVLRHHPENPDALSAEDRFLAAAKVKAEGILQRLEAVLEGLHKLAAAGTESEPAGFAPSTEPTSALIDAGTFTHLLSAARRTEFGVNTDAIISARDRDFRKGEYRKAHGVIEVLAKRFDASAQQRAQALAQEDIAYRSGILKMSPRQWQAKLRRDRVNTLNIERAQSYFRRLLSALSVMAAQAETQTPPAGEEP
ncbi:MAG: hypothetical protein JW809_04410 [Pirellulales bacterium]|nr:hypothetical protein [Pirellulales bacterium]